MLLLTIQNKFRYIIVTLINKKVEEKPKGNPELVTFNPGSVRYEDLKAYMDKQNAQRYSSNNNI